MQAPIAPGRGRLYRRLAHDVAVLGLPASPPAPPVTEADLAGLPHAAVRYLTFMGVAGRPADFSTDDRWCDRTAPGGPRPLRDGRRRAADGCPPGGQPSGTCRKGPSPMPSSASAGAM